VSALGSLEPRPGHRARKDCARALKEFWELSSHIWMRLACLSMTDFSVSFSRASSSMVLRPEPLPAGMERWGVTDVLELPREGGRRALVGDGGPTFSLASTNSSCELPRSEPDPSSMALSCVFGAFGAFGSRRMLAYVTAPLDVGTR